LMTVLPPWISVLRLSLGVLLLFPFLASELQAQTNLATPRVETPPGEAEASAREQELQPIPGASVSIKSEETNAILLSMRDRHQRDSEIESIREALPEALGRYEELLELTDGRPSPLSMAYHWARMIELVHAAETIAVLLEDPELQGDELVVAGGPRREAVGVLEAPRGTLVHHYRIDENDLVTMANLIVSTTSNNEPMNRAVTDVARRHLSGREITILAPLCALMIWIGWNPTPILERMEPSVQAVLERVERAAPGGQVSATVELGVTAAVTTQPKDDEGESLAADDQ